MRSEDDVVRIRAADANTSAPPTGPSTVKIVREITLTQLLGAVGAVVLFGLQQYVQSERNIDKVILLTTQASETNTRVKELAAKIDQGAGINVRQDEQITYLDRRVTSIETRITPAPTYTVRK